MAKRQVNLQNDKVSAEILGDGTNRLDALTAGGDFTNNRQIVQPKGSLGSGGVLTNADLTLHTGACTLNRMIVSCTTGGTIALSDAAGAAGTAFITLTFVASTNPVTIDFGGLALGTGLFADITTFVGSACINVGPAVS